MESFFNASWSIMLELAPWLLLGTLVAGLLHILLPADFLRRHLSGSKGVFKAVIFGVPLPLCSCGVVPVGLSLKKSGSSDGATVAFLISTPQTGIDSIFVSASMLGWPFAIFKLGSAAVTGLVGGWLTNLSGSTTDATDDASNEKQTSPTIPNRLTAFFNHADELLYSIWRWLVFGVVVSAAIEVFLPTDAFSGLAAYGGIVAMLVMLLISLPLYVCATASVPIAASLVAGGLPTGAALVFLMAGPATNIATLGAVYRTLGRRPLTIYLATVILGSIACGLAFGFVVNIAANDTVHKHDSAAWWAQVGTIILLVLFAKYAVDDLRRLVRRWFPSPTAASGITIEVPVDGMTCNSCVKQLEKALMSDGEVSSVDVTLSPGQVAVQGDLSEAKVRQLIELAGFRPL
jgi:uncharacterized membrane protein YraQ (UPF0718 family)/copper chaperone CopZ